MVRIFHSFLGIIIFLLLSCTLPVPKITPSTLETPVFPYKIHKFQLPNGLKLVAVPFDSPGVIAYYTVVRVGSRNETDPGYTGYAHFFEHMMFRGTKRFPRQRYNKALLSIGANFNAFAEEDITCYMISAPSNALETIIELESDRFKNLTYDLEAFQKEAGAILGEFNIYHSWPKAVMYERLCDLAFTVHPYKYPMGLEKDIKNMPHGYDYSWKFFDRFYRPGNSSIIVVGDFKLNELKGLIERYYGDWKPKDYLQDIPQEPPQTTPRRADILWEKPTSPKFIIGYHIPACDMQSVDIPALELLGELYFGQTSKLYQELVIQKRIVTELEAETKKMRDPHLFTISVTLGDKKDLEEVQNSIKKVLKMASKNPPQNRLLNEVRSHIKSSFMLGLQSPESLAYFLSRFIALRDDPEDLNRYYRLLDRVRPEDISRVARRYLIETNSTTVTLTYKGEKSQDSKIEKVLIPIKDSPLIGVRLLFCTGSADDPAGKEGLCALTARMIAHGGTQDMDSSQVLKALYPMAVKIDAQVERETTVFTATVHKDSLEQFYQIFRQLILHPRFDPSDFARIRRSMLDYLRYELRGGRDEDLGKEALQVFIYQEHPYGHPVCGTVSGLESITLKDVKDFYYRFFTQARVMLGLGGGFDKKFVERFIKDLSNLPVGKPPKRSLPPPKPIEDIEVMLIEKSCDAIAISLGFPIDLTRRSKDYWALLLANTYFGEHRTFTGVLMNKMRVKRGLNYGDYSYIENFVQDKWTRFCLPNIPRHQQYFSIWIRPVLPANAHFAIRQAIRELELLVENGLSKDDFEKTRTYLLNSSKLWRQTLHRRLGIKMDDRYYGISDYFEQLEKGLKDLELEDVNSAIKRHLQYKNIKIAVVCPDAKRLKEDLISNKISPIVYQTPGTPADILQEDKLIERYPLKINIKRLKIVPVEKIFER